MNGTYGIIIIFIMLLFAVYFIKQNRIKNKAGKKVDQGLLPYTKATFLLTKAENNFYQVLKSLLKDTSYVICPKVRLADIIKVNTNTDRQSYFNRIQSKHIDFLICNDDIYFNPIMAIELDDSSHEKENRKERDEFIDQVFSAANLQIIHIRAGYSYTYNEIKDKLSEVLTIENFGEEQLG